MPIVALPSITTPDILRVVDPVTYARGLDYARKQRVSSIAWHPEVGELFGRVAGQARQRYTTRIQCEVDGADLTVRGSTCSCPVGGYCKHVAALLITALASGGQPAAGRLPTGQPAAAPGPPPWQRRLDELLAPGSGQGIPAAAGLEPLGVRFELAEAQQGRSRSVQLGLRLVRRNARGRWVQGKVNWNLLGAERHRYYYQRDPLAGYPAELRGWMGTLATLLTSGAGYGYSAQVLPLDTFDSPMLWQLLAEAGRHGVSLLGLDGRDVVVHAPVTAGLDLVRDGTKLVVEPLLADADGPIAAARLRTIGKPAHGLYWWDSPEAQDGALENTVVHLAPLDGPLPEIVAGLLEDGRPLRIPGTGREAFLHEYLPTLARRTRLTSSDGSVPMAETEPARLHLALEHLAAEQPAQRSRKKAPGAGAKRLHLRWSWSQRIAGQVSSRPLVDRSDPGHLQAGELRILGQVATALAGHPAAWRPTFPDAASGFPGDPTVLELSGIDAARFVAEGLDALSDLGTVDLETTGEAPDYTELTDAPEIVVSAAETDSRDWFDLGVQVSLGGVAVPFNLLFTALAAGDEFLVLPNGNYFSLHRPEYERLRQLIEEARELTDRDSDGLRISHFQAALWEDLAELATRTELAEGWRSAVSGLLDAASAPPAPVPETLRAQLRPYQRDGFAWLAFLYDHGLGGVLADDMGLGKTLQALALMCRTREAGGTLPFLVVAPTSVVPNWAAETARFAPGLRCVALTETLAKSGRDAAALAADADVVVVSYALFRIDNDAFAAQQWAGLVLDEAQFVKNPATKASTQARNFPAPFKLAVSGTPLENNLMELWSLLAIAAPGLFPSAAKFEEQYRKPIEKDGDSERLARLRRRIRPLMLRRTKELVVKELPPKQEQVLELDLLPKHRTVYQRHLQRERQKVLGLLGDLDKNRFQIFRSLTMLRQLSLDASLVDAKYASTPSSKLDALMELLPDIVEEGHQALVFSQFTSFLGKAAERLDTAGIPYAYLDGSTRKRGAVIDSFTSGQVPVFLISLKAGGFGLNLTQADYCFLLDPWWNPANENQAVDRAHRIGQQRNVMVYRLVAKDTIEEKVMALKDRKAKLFSAVMDEDAMFSSALTAEDIRSLLDG